MSKLSKQLTNKKNLPLLVLFIISTLCFICCLGSSIFRPFRQYEDNATSELIAEPTHQVLAKTDQKETYKVTRIIDGDTIEIDKGGNPEKIRLLGIDTPEKNDCYFLESTKKITELLLNESIQYKYDHIQAKFDSSGRTLAHVYLNDVYINQVMVNEGFATVYTAKGSDFIEDLLMKEAIAKTQKIGIWGSACACKKGEEISRKCTSCNKLELTLKEWNCSEYKSTVDDLSCSSLCSTTNNTNQIYQTPAPTPIPTSAPGPSWTCNCNKTCPNMYSCEEAYFQLNVCGCKERDGNNDGVPCESICN